MDDSNSKVDHAGDSPDSDYVDPVIEAFIKDVDRTLLRENLKLSVDERFRKFEGFARFVRELQGAGERASQRR